MFRRFQGRDWGQLVYFHVFIDLLFVVNYGQQQFLIQVTSLYMLRISAFVWLLVRNLITVHRLDSYGFHLLRLAYLICFLLLFMESSLRIVHTRLSGEWCLESFSARLAHSIRKWSLIWRAVWPHVGTTSWRDSSNLLIIHFWCYQLYFRPQQIVKDYVRRWDCVLLKEIDRIHGLLNHLKQSHPYYFLEGPLVEVVYE